MYQQYYEFWLAYCFELEVYYTTRPDYLAVSTVNINDRILLTTLTSMVSPQLILLSWSHS